MPTIVACKKGVLTFLGIVIKTLDPPDRPGQGGGGLGRGIPTYPVFCPQDTNIRQNRKMRDTKYLKLF